MVRPGPARCLFALANNTKMYYSSISNAQQSSIFSGACIPDICRNSVCDSSNSPMHLHALPYKYCPTFRRSAFHLFPGYPAGIPGRTLPVERVGSDLNTRGYLDPAGNYATGTRVPAVIRVPARFEDPRFIILPQYL